MQNKRINYLVTRRDLNIDRRRCVYVTEIKYKDLVVKGWGYSSREAEINASRRWRMIRKDVLLRAAKDYIDNDFIFTYMGNVPFSYTAQITERRSA